MLKDEAEAELQLAHAYGSAGSRVGFDVGNLPGTRSTEAIQALVAGYGKHGMIEKIVRIEAELRLVAFGDGESFQQREVIVEGVRTVVRIKAHIADLAAGRERQWS